MIRFNEHSVFSLLAFILLLSSRVIAVPAATPKPSFVSIPLTPASNSSEELQGPVVLQQHINRGLRRLARMTGRQSPSDYDLLSAIRNRILNLPSGRRSHYKLDKINETLAALHQRLHAKTPGSVATRDEDSVLSTNVSSIHNTHLSIEAQDYGYMAQLKIGSNQTVFTLLVDSGSSDLWVPAEGCHGDDGGDCGPHTALGPHVSKTFNATKQPWSINYVSGTVSGYLVRDDVTIAGLKMTAHEFGVATNETKDFTPNSIPFDGLLGTGKDTLSRQGVPTLLTSLYKAKRISAPIISYKLPRWADFKNDGEMTLGGMDPQLYDPKTVVTMKNINTFGYWAVDVGAVQIGNTDLKWSNRTILMDTGTTLMIAPQADVDAIHSHIPGSKRDDSGSWTVPCNMTTVLSLTIGGKKFPLDPRDIAFFQVEGGSPDCMSGIAAGGVGPFYQNNDWLVGDVFLKNVYFSTDDEKNTVTIAKQK
ncbi:aspartic peptidase A1 [Agrocybe pediades]|nr:aspartic peptidase A1 [Agrocybe pediades]